MKEAYQPPFVASDPTSDCVGLFETILEQQLSHFNGIAIKTTLQKEKLLMKLRIFWCKQGKLKSESLALDVIFTP